MALFQSVETKNRCVVPGEAGMKVCESTREGSRVKTTEGSVWITKDMNGSHQTGKHWGLPSCSFTSWQEGPCSLSKRMATRVSLVPCFFLLSNQGDEDTQKEELWTTDSSLPGDLQRMNLLRIKWGSGIHCLSFRVGIWTKFWTASAWERLFICFEDFLLASLTCFVSFWNETQINLPAVGAALLLSHWPTPQLWASS